MEQEYMWEYHMPKKHMDKPMANTYPWECTGVGDMKHMNEMCPNVNKHLMPIQSLGSKWYGYIYQVTVMNLNKHLPNKMSGNMPKYISKDEFNSVVNDCMCELTKQDKVYKDMLKSRCVDEFEEHDRSICPYCNGMLKSVVEIALITSLLNGGCAFCY